jgi:hypothetical protein
MIGSTRRDALQSYDDLSRKALRARDEPGARRGALTAAAAIIGRMSGPHDPQQPPADSDLDDLPAEIAEHPGPFTISAVDENGVVWSATITREHIAAAFADRRRLEDEDDAA